MGRWGSVWAGSPLLPKAPSQQPQAVRVPVTHDLRIDTTPLKKRRAYVNTRKRRRQTWGERQCCRHTWPRWKRDPRECDVSFFLFFYLALLDLRRWISHNTQTVRPHLYFNVQRKKPRKGKCDMNVCESPSTADPQRGGQWRLSLCGWSSWTASCICPPFCSCSAWWFIHMISSSQSFTVGYIIIFFTNDNARQKKENINKNNVLAIFFSKQLYGKESCVIQ